MEYVSRKLAWVVCSFCFVFQVLFLEGVRRKDREITLVFKVTCLLICVYLSTRALEVWHMCMKVKEQLAMSLLSSTGDQTQVIRLTC